MGGQNAMPSMPSNKRGDMTRGRTTFGKAQTDAEEVEHGFEKAPQESKPVVSLSSLAFGRARARVQLQPNKAVFADFSGSSRLLSGIAHGLPHDAGNLLIGSLASQ